MSPFGPWPGEPGPGGGLTALNSPSPRLPVTTVAGVATLNQLIIADWTVGVARVYAVDGTAAVSGRGWADAASNSAADLATATAAAGALAVKTIEELAVILPRDGAARRVHIVINEGTYTGDLGLLLNGLSNYDRVSVWGTATRANAGIVKFDGSNASLVQAGGVTATGLNATGYNPTGAATTTSIPCTKVGGGAPAFAAEPGIPLGLRIRFDVATTTAALRGAVAGIVQVTGGNTLIPRAALAAVPVATDVFYIEQPGIVTPGCRISLGATARAFLVGQAINGTLTVDGGDIQSGFTTATAVSNQFPALLVAQRVCQTPAGVNGTNVNVGSTIRNSGTWTNDVWGGQRVSFVDGTCVGAAEYINPAGTFVISAASTYGAGLRLQGGGISNQSTDPSDGIGSAGTLATRIIGPGTVAGVELAGTRICLRLLSITGMGAKPAIALRGTCDVVVNAIIAGATGNTDVGLDLTLARGSRIILQATPTVTGTAGDVRLSDGTIKTWAQCAAGVVDAAGNVIASPTTSPLHYTIVANGAVAVTINNAPAGSAAAPARYVKVPDGAGGFYTFPSLT